ncbi:methyltransferase domain-containing protein [candidate division WWE3 bacterium]|nr:methyltransferase domain-containing protein [candidate division WWE3 bacterium]
MSKKSWEDKEVSQIYVKSIDPNSANEINLTKKLYHDPFFFSLLPDLTNKRILDIGCGDGYMLNKLSFICKNCNLVGMDLPNMLEETAIEKDAIELIPADCHELPFENNSFDLVISSLMFHWVVDLSTIAKEMFRILKPGGTFVTSSINPNTFHVGYWENLDTDKPKYVLTKDITKERQFEVYLNKTVGPLTYYMRPIERYKQIFEQVGFNKVKTEEPLLKDDKVLGKYPELTKYSFYPLYLFTTGIKKTQD